MKMAVKLAEFNVRVGHWNKGTMTAYSRTRDVSRCVIENVWCVGNYLNPLDADNDEIADYEDRELDNGWIASSSDTYPKI